MAEEINLRGQLAVWVILAIILVVAILMFFFIRRDVPIISPPAQASFDAEKFVQTCVQQRSLEALEIMLPKGGFLQPKNYRMYNNNPVEYVCYNYGFYEPCVMQHPLLITEMEKEMEGYLFDTIQPCFDDLREETENRRAEIELSDFSKENVDVEMHFDKIEVLIDRKTTIEKNEEIKVINTYETVIEHPAYNLARIALDIAEQESLYCYFEWVGYMVIYPRYKIKTTMMSDPTAIYEITDRENNVSMAIAVRSCAFPAGM